MSLDQLTSADYANDYVYWDNRENGTFIRVATSGNTPYPLTAPDGRGAIKRRALTQKELAASGGVYTALDRAWLLPVTLLPAPLQSDPPHPADQWLDGNGITWTVLEADLNNWETWYKLVARDLVLVNDLHDSVTILAPTNLQDPSGLRVPVFNPIYSGIAGRVQVQTSDVADNFGKHALRTTYLCWLAQQVNVTSECRVTIDNVTFYQVTGVRTARRIDELQALELEILP